MCARERGPGHRRIHRRAADHRTAGLRQLRRQSRRRVSGCAIGWRVHRNAWPSSQRDLVRRRHSPDLRGTRAQLLAHVARRLDHGHAGGVADAAAAVTSVKPAVSVSATIGRTRSTGMPSSSDTISACAARVPPMSGLPVTTAALPSAPSVTVALELMPALNQKPQARPRPCSGPSGALPVRAVAHRFEHCLEADRPVRRTVRRVVAFGHGVLQPQLDRVDPERARDLVDQRLGGERRHRRAGRAIRRDLRLVDDHVVGFDEEVGDGVRRERSTSRRRRTANRGRRPPRNRAMRDAATIVPSFFAPIFIADLRAGRRTRRPEHLVARHHHLDRPLRLARQHDRERLEVDGNLPAEPAADLAWRSP